GRRQLSRLFIVSVCLAILLTFPYLVGMMRAGFDNFGVLRESLATDDSRPLEVTGAAMHGAALMIAGTEIHSLAGPERFQEYLVSIPDGYWFLGGLAWFVGFAAIWLVI